MKAAGRFLDVLERYRPLFLARNRREKVLLATFIAVIALIWAGSLPGRVGEELRRLRVASDAIERQDFPLGQRARIEAEYQAALESLNPELFPPRQQVVAQLESIARQTGLNPVIAPSNSARSDRLTFHTINVSLSSVAYSKLAEYQRAVAAALPSVNLKTIVLSSASRAAGATEMKASLTFEAIEFIH